MLARLNGLIVECSSTWQKFLIVFVVFVGSLLILQRLSNEFPAVSGGVPPFDMQNALTPAEIFQQLNGYTDQAFDLYIIFQAVDFVFPFFASLTIASLCAFALRNFSIDLYKAFLARKYFILLMMPAVFDYLENINLLWVVNTWPQQVEIAANLAVASKIGKLTTMTLAFIVTALLLLGAAGTWITRRSSTPDQAEENGD
ncbi:MAG: hypothetical protein QF790_03475 [Gammaproteobacteria bacterium]|jgi:hypothetical protein|nr:hypothetical protein [Gammaproteobacteria bacterium]MDP6616210.1 hypothetical protein [Gammaproteobacteria bacterium]MDP6695582.1 hypothetical protein [Gammaproteobacteria bacterium]